MIKNERIIVRAFKKSKTFLRVRICALKIFAIYYQGHKLMQCILVEALPTRNNLYYYTR